MNSLEQLEQRISKLEEQVNKNSISMFGRSYSQTGSLNSDYLIKTKGQVKIQFGSKFIDLIKDGKINTEIKVIYSVNTINEIGSKEGFYVTQDGQIYLRLKDQIISITTGDGATYVSFMQPQITDGEQKTQALQNIGFLHETLDSLDENAIQNGIIYVSDEQKLYTIVRGVISEYSASIPNPYKNQLIISKSGTEIGSLVIVGEGLNNSIAFSTFYIYEEQGTGFLNFVKSLQVTNNNASILDITPNKITSSVPFQCNNIQSIGATESSGFKLTTTRGQSTLTVDNVIERNKSNSSPVDAVSPIYSKAINVIISSSGEYGDSTEDNQYTFTLKYLNNLKSGDYFYVYPTIINNEGQQSYIKLLFQVPASTDSETETNSVIATLVSELTDSIETMDFSNKITYLVTPGYQLKYNEDTIDCIEYSDITEESNTESIKARFGYIESIQESGVTKNLFGVKGNIGLFDSARYNGNTPIPISDNSTNFVSTELIHKLLPYGSIIMFNGNSSDIPEGWNICDGTNGTPNLINYFIKAGLTSGETETQEIGSGSNTIQSYSLIFIMKII